MKPGRFTSSKQIKRGDVTANYYFFKFRIADEANDTTLWVSYNHRAQVTFDQESESEITYSELVRKKA